MKQPPCSCERKAFLTRSSAPAVDQSQSSFLAGSICASSPTPYPCTHSTFTVLCRHAQTCSPLIHLMPHSQLGSNRIKLPSYLSSCTVNTCPFCSLFSATFFTFLCFFLLALALKHSSEVPSSALQQEKDVVYLTQKISVFGDLPLGTGYSLDGVSSVVTNQTKYIH